MRFWGNWDFEWVLFGYIWNIKKGKYQESTFLETPCRYPDIFEPGERVRLWSAN